MTDIDMSRELKQASLSYDVTLTDHIKTNIQINKKRVFDWIGYDDGY